MDHKAAGENLQIISAILEKWNAEGSIGDLEYDILLDRIKNLYGEVKFCARPEPEVRIETKSVPSEAAKGVSAHADREAKGPMSPGRRETVRALYGDGKASCKEAPLQEYAAENQVGGAASGKDTSAASGSPYKQVLGDVIGNCGPTVADSLNASTSDVTAKLGHEKVSSLRTCIGLNDKYMFVRDLFGGDREAYENTIDALDGFGSIEDAMIYIHDNFDWKSDEPAADALCGMLAAKLM